MTLREKFEAWASTRLMTIEEDPAWEAYQSGHAEGVKEAARRCAAICHDEALESHIAWKLIRAEYPEAFTSDPPADRATPSP